MGGRYCISSAQNPLDIRCLSPLLCQGAHIRCPGTEDASIAQFPAKMGELGVETAWKAVKGETVKRNVDTGTAVVTSENAAEFK